MSCNFSKFIIVGLFFVALSAQANAAIEVGDTIRFQNGPGSPGGEFGVADALTPTITEFITFCLEKNEYLNFSDGFYVYDISGAADGGGKGGPSPDPISEKTAWLYYNFRQGTLTGYDYGDVSDTDASRVSSANALQNAVWFIEEEQDSAGVGAAFYTLADDEYDDFMNDANYGGNMQTAIDLVQAMNIRYHDINGKKGQSQLYMNEDPGFGGGVVPEPATVTVWAMLGVSGMFFGRRSRRKNKKN